MGQTSRWPISLSIMTEGNTNMQLFSKRHYEWLARFMATEMLVGNTWEGQCRALADALARQADKDGTNFKYSLFLKACEKGS
jgi:hypothetical protein